MKSESYKLLICPSQTSVLKLREREREKLKLIFDSFMGTSTDKLISKLNTIIRGWANYYHPFCFRKSQSQSQSFESIDAYIFQRYMRYELRRHSNKGK